MTTLNPIAVRVLSMPGWRLRIWLAVVITLALAGLPLPIAGLALWCLTVACLVTIETLARMVGDQRRARFQSEAFREEHAAHLAERDARITALEADLAQARIGPMPRAETVEEALYKRVGLHPRAPEFMLVAARRAFRIALHPDRHPRHRQQAHDRFVRAEAAFDEIAADRRC